MSLVPLMFRDWWDDFNQDHPMRLIDQHFGMGLRRDDLLSKFNQTPSLFRNGYFRPWRSELLKQDSGSTITTDKDKFQTTVTTRDAFQVILDVQQFSPKEITVKTQNNCVIVEGKHEEKQDEHGFISRHFVRRYMLPADHESTDVVSSLSSDGVLTITAPKRALPPPPAERVVHITQTGPAKEQNISVEQAKE